MSQQQNNEVVISKSRVLTRVVGSTKMLCNVCNQEMKGNTFESLKCENGHVIGEVSDGGARITAEVSSEHLDSKHFRMDNGETE